MSACAIDPCGYHKLSSFVVISGCCHHVLLSPKAIVVRGKCQNCCCLQVEGRSVGKVDTETYRIYARAWSALYILPVLMLLLALAERAFFGLQNWWLSVWSNANASTLVSWQHPLIHGYC